MNQDLYCDIHSNNIVHHIYVSQGSTKKLQCGECISNKMQEMSLIYIPKIVNQQANLILDNWPPLSDVQLRKKMIELKNENEDVSEKVIDFYEQLKQEIISIITEKKKEQLIKVQEAKRYKEKIIDQYCEMASLDKISQCFVNESQKYEDIEKKLKEQIDSQFDRIDEYTSILSTMMKQYELISKLNVKESTQIKDNVIEILKNINLISSNNFDFGNEVLTLENIATYQKKLEKAQEIHKKDNTMIDILVNQLDLCNQQLTSKMNKPDQYLDDFLSNQQILIAKYQIEKMEFVNDIYSALNQSQYLIKQNIDACSQTDFKYFNELKKKLLFESQNISYPDKSNTSQYIQETLDQYGKIQLKKISNSGKYYDCLLTYKLKPQKKYIFRVKFYKNNNNSEFYIGLAQGYDSIFSSNICNLGLGFQIASKSNQYLGTQVICHSDNELILEFKICVQDKFLQYSDYPNNSKEVKCINNIFIDAKMQYHLGFQFINDYIGDEIEIFDYQELDQFPINCS